MDLLDNLRLMAGYNRWMNERLYAACAQLSDAQRKQDCRAFFRSIHGTLNHLLLADRGWLSRFEGRLWPYSGLGQELYSDFEELRRERQQTDQDLVIFLAGMTVERLQAVSVFRNSSGQEFRHPLGPALTHLFNHQTHHRGQVTTLLSQFGVDPGVTDVIAYYRSVPGSTA